MGAPDIGSLICSWALQPRAHAVGPGAGGTGTHAVAPTTAAVASHIRHCGGCGRSGSVRLPLRSSSAATVEATWLPVASGMLPMPHLLLPDIPHQVGGSRLGIIRQKGHPVSGEGRPEA